MYIEWLPENSYVKNLLLYYLQLFIDRYEKPYFFSKGNITSCKKIVDLSNKYHFNPYFYLYLNFVTNEKNMEIHGFKFMSSSSYLKNFVNLVEKKEYRKFDVQKPLYTIIKNDLIKINIDTIKTDTQTLADLIFTNKISLYTFLYLIIVFNINNIIKPEAVEHKINTIMFYIERGILPRDFKFFSFDSYEEYCARTTATDVFPPTIKSDS